MDSAAAHSLKCRWRDGAPCVSAFGMNVHSTILISYLRRRPYFLHNLLSRHLPLNNFTIFSNIDFNFLLITWAFGYTIYSECAFLLILELWRVTFTFNNVEVLILSDYRFNSVSCLVVLESLHAVRC